MRRIHPAVVLLLALVVGVLCIFGDNSYGKLGSLQRTLQLQQDQNEELRQTVGALQHDVQGLKVSPRAIEKAARDELGMVRPDDVVVLFDHATTDHVSPRHRDGDGGNPSSLRR